MDPVLPDSSNFNKKGNNKFLIFAFLALFLIGLIVFYSADVFGDSSNLKGMLKKVEVHSSSN